MLVNIFSICTGNYDVFFEDFYTSAERNFLHGHKKRYFVFTDGKIPQSENIVRVDQPKLGWPFDTMFRFKMFNSVRDKLDGEYVFFFNANAKVLSSVGDEVLPGIENDYLMGVEHPGYRLSNNYEYPYERRPESNVYMPYGSGKDYFQGFFNGGRTQEFMNMSSLLEDKIDYDVKRGIIPVWHDESALNWYYSQKNPLKLPMSYAYPEAYKEPFERKIIQIEKNSTTFSRSHRQNGLGHA
jgi:hypothetical protein